jgi:hypothetical protein
MPRQMRIDDFMATNKALVNFAVMRAGRTFWEGGGFDMLYS